MNFFKRRKFLKRANTLDLVPLRLLDHEIMEDAKVAILLPRYRGKIFGPALQQRTNRKYINIKLDEFGSATWLLINGTDPVGVISEKLREKYPEKLSPGDETEDRVSKFIFVLYDQDYITFRELQEPGN